VPLPPPSIVDITARDGAPSDTTTYVGLRGVGTGVGVADGVLAPEAAPVADVVTTSVATAGAAPREAEAPVDAGTGATRPPPPSGESAAGATAPSRRDRHHRHRRRHRWLPWWLAVVAVVILATAGWAAAERIDRPPPPTALTAAEHPSVTVAGTVPPLPWPAKGQGAVSIPALGYTAQSGPESAVPIASLTKMTNAVVVLHDHPLPAGASGPMVTVTADDVAEYDLELHNDQSTVPIRTGEVLTERQMLEAMLTQSANDMAYSLAVWDAGTLPAFVAKMNAMAVALGATSTHYVDASGYDPGSVSTAADCLRIAAAGMADPTFAEVVGMKSVTLPLVGTVPNIVTEIGSNNVVGIKSGYTSEAGGCMVLAADREVQGRSVLVIVAVLGQPTPPPTPPTTTTTTTTAPPPTTTAAPGAAPPPTTRPPTATTTTTIPLNDLNVPDPFRYTRPVVEGLLDATEAAVVPVTLATAGQPMGEATAVWGGAAHRVPVVAAAAAWIVGWPGQEVAGSTHLGSVPAGGTAGSRIGTTHYLLGTQLETVPLKLATTVPEPSWWWRLVHA
jgi:D-alanyl-D-alanine carboxypeptidase (penicillin-binding protein 5/6)